ncbi:MAG TPA: hypothetical protein VGQ18_10315 [Gemmatimonadales bacterium]|jgi:hypothetical protein|nr:hypothetical protein [Gemmatimonadales bacterium]
MNLHLKRSLALATLAVASVTGCAKDATAPEVLPQTLATVQAGVDMVTTGQVKIVGTCAGSVPLNCPGGTLAGPAYVTLTRTADSVALVTGQDYYYFSATMSAVSSGIPITVPLVGACTLTIDTSPGASPTITLTGNVQFASGTLNGPIDRLDFSNIAVTGFETADVSITGSVSCAAASFGASFYILQLQDMFAQAASLCSAPGPTLLEPCPLVPVTSSRREQD